MLLLETITKTLIIVQKIVNDGTGTWNPSPSSITYFKIDIVSKANFPSFLLTKSNLDLTKTRLQQVNYN